MPNLTSLTLQPTHYFSTPATDAANSWGTGATISVAAQVTQAAEQVTQTQGMVYEETSGLYYDYRTGYYYDSQRKLYYEGNSGTWYAYDYEEGKYVVHQQNGDAEKAEEKDSKVNRKTKKKKSKKSKRKRNRSRSSSNGSSGDCAVTSAVELYGDLDDVKRAGKYYIGLFFIWII